MALTPWEADPLAEAAIEAYLHNCMPTMEDRTPENFANVLEMLISKASRGVEKFHSWDKAMEALARTYANLMSSPTTYDAEGKPHDRARH